MDKLPSWFVYFAPRCKVHLSLSYAHQTVHQTPQQQGSHQACLGQQSGLYHGFIICCGCHPLAPAWHHSLLMVPLLRAPRVALPMPVSAQCPTLPTAPPPPSGHPGVGPYSSTLPDSRSCLSQKRSSSSSVTCCGIGSYRSSGSQKTLYPPQWKQS